MIFRFTLHHLFKKLISSANTIGAVITERNILTPLRLFVMTMPIQKAVASGKRNNPPSPQWRTEVELHAPFQPTPFFVTIYL
jgi:hypothetical protein